MLERVEDAVAELATALDVAERVAPVEPVEMLPVLAESAARLERIMRAAVHRAAVRGASVDELGTALGLPAAAVLERYLPGRKDLGPVDVDRPHP